MTTSRALIASALLVSVAVAGSAWLVADKAASGGRYQLVNTGAGSTVRLDRETGDLVRCEDEGCAQMVKDGALIGRPRATEYVDSAGRKVPPPPPGYVLDE